MIYDASLLVFNCGHVLGVMDPPLPNMKPAKYYSRIDSQKYGSSKVAFETLALE